MLNLSSGGNLGETGLETRAGSLGLGVIATEEVDETLHLPMGEGIKSNEQGPRIQEWGPWLE